MDLIYGQFKGDEIEDINVLQDYSFDCVVGIGDNNVNDFECRVQEYNNKCEADNILYIEFTEYGGIIDRIEHDSDSGEVVYKGRTWHGILNSHILTGRKSYGGEINAIISQMVQDAGLDFLFVVDLVDLEDRSIEIEFHEVSYEKVYDAIIRLLRRSDVRGKLLLKYYDGRVHLGAVMGVDYSTDEEFDISKTPYRTGRTENTVNHLVCLGRGEGDNRAVIHLFTDDVSQDLEHKHHIQPYTLRDNPLKDAHYILDERNKIMRGKDEIADILDIPNCEIVTNYIPMDSRDDENDWTYPPTDWSTQYFNKYYEDEKDKTTGEIKKKLLKETKRDEFRMLYEEPDGWNEHFTDYYRISTTKEPAWYKQIIRDNGIVEVKANENEYGARLINGDFTSVKEQADKELSEGNGIRYDEETTRPTTWETTYSDYYIDSGTTGKAQVQALSIEKYSVDDAYNGIDHLTHDRLVGNSYVDLEPLQVAPPDWAWAWGNYVTRNKNALQQWVYTAVEGVHHDHMEKITSSKAPTGWSDNWGQYYVRAKKDEAKKGKYLKYDEGYFITASQAVSIGKLKKQSDKKPYPKYQPKHFYVKVTDPDTAPTFGGKSTKHGVFEKYSLQVAPKWDYPTKHYYKKVVTRTPYFVSGSYYKKYEDVLQVPEWGLKTYYYAVEDRYRKLVEKGIEKLEELNNKDTLGIDLELDSNYDVLDVMGLTDPVTGKQIHNPILRKIAKIKKDILSVEYETD